MTDKQPQRVYWIASEGSVAVVSTPVPPTWAELQQYVGGDVEHVHVYYAGKEAHMYIHEEGRRMFTERNPIATEIYFAAARFRGLDPEDTGASRKQAEAFAVSLGIPKENVFTMGDPTGKPAGIYGPAILLEGFNDDPMHH